MFNLQCGQGPGVPDAPTGLQYIQGYREQNRWEFPTSMCKEPILTVELHSGQDMLTVPNAEVQHIGPKKGTCQKVNRSTTTQICLVTSNMSICLISSFLEMCNLETAAK